MLKGTLKNFFKKYVSLYLLTKWSNKHLVAHTRCHLSSGSYTSMCEAAAKPAIAFPPLGPHSAFPTPGPAVGGGVWSPTSSKPETWHGIQSVLRGSSSCLWVLDGSYLLSLYIYLSFLTAHPVHFKLQCQIQRKEPFRDGITSVHIV